jgi:hypothetical protein
MMNADDCRKRAEECLTAAHDASDRDGQRAWRQLSDMWLLWSGRLVQLCSKDNEPSEATVNAETTKRPVATAEPITERAISRNGKAAEVADRLRLTLALSE